MKNFWNEQNTTTAIDMYVASGNDNSGLGDIAKEIGTTVPAVRSKLVSAKVYQKAEVARRRGGASPVRKINLVNEIAELTGIEGLESFENASKADLEKMVDFLKSE